MFEPDSYIVVSGGKLYWITDAFTATDKYPYSVHTGWYNYIRNSVKIVTDAYTGDINFYVYEPDDPLILTYQKIFPGMFQGFDQMPEELKSHVRYPEGIFSIQARIYATYHMKDPRVFYNKEDMWALPREMYGGQPKTMQGYYLVTKLPGEDQAEFILLVPFVPTERDNMISWMAA
jgi:uncharacterized membrane protein (UPF0182 family)